MDHSIKRKIMRHRKMETKEEINKQFAADIRESCWPPPARVSSAPIFIKSLRVGFVGLVLSVATAWAGPSSIQGTVKDAKGQPIKGADVRVESKDGKQLFNTVKTDTKGRYISQGLQPGVYRVTLMVNGAVKASIMNTQTKANQPTQLNFDFKPTSQAGNNATGRKHMAWVPNRTGSHIGGNWVEVDDEGNPHFDSNVQTYNVRR